MLFSEGRIFVAPACCGGLPIERRFEMVNPTGIALSFKWKVPEKYDSVITVEPEQGVLKAYQSTNVVLTFRPRSIQRYVVKIPCEIICENKKESVTKTHI